MLAPERAQLSASHETPMNNPRTISQEYWLPAKSFIMAGAIGEFRKTASKAANARMRHGQVHVRPSNKATPLARSRICRR